MVYIINGEILAVCLESPPVSLSKQDNDPRVRSRLNQGASMRVFFDSSVLNLDSSAPASSRFSTLSNRPSQPRQTSGNDGPRSENQTTSEVNANGM
jgi:hypothetical protein